MVLLSILALAAACTSTDGSTSAAPGTYTVDKTFTSFHNLLGGEDILGPAISLMFQYNQLQCQYVETALMCFNSEAAAIDQYALYALGGLMNVHDAPLSATPPASERVVNGYIIYSDFVPLYDKLYGARYVGRPLTQARPNYSLQRTEQFFENVGFYHLFSDPPGEVHLLAYGLYGCSTGCTYQGSAENKVVLDSASLQQPFLNALTLMGGIPDFGKPLSEAQTASDGYLEQVYQNVVLYAPTDQSDSARLRPLPIILGMPTTQPGPQVYNEANGVIFITVQGNLGYHVPIVFKDFIDRHGGLSISGNPISEAMDVGGGVFRQCFQNYCLDYQSSAVKMVALGEKYLTYTPGQQVSPQFAFSSASVSIQLSEEMPRIRADATQQIDLTVISTQDQQPIPNLEAVLVVTYPDGTQYSAHFPPTQANGFTSVIVPAKPGTPNGSIIPYQVCLNVPSDSPICASDSYLIWDY
jgi:hypothetical protein